MKKNKIYLIFYNKSFSIDINDMSRKLYYVLISSHDVSTNLLANRPMKLAPIAIDYINCLQSFVKYELFLQYHY